MTIVRWAALEIGAFSCIAASTASSASDEVVLIRDQDFGPDRAFVRELIETVRRETPVKSRAAHNVSVGREGRCRLGARIAHTEAVCDDHRRPVLNGT